jgi:hypothetical protein
VKVRRPRRSNLHRTEIVSATSVKLEGDDDRHHAKRVVARNKNRTGSNQHSTNDIKTNGETAVMVPFPFIN